jgi:uncharacterized protein DUF4245
VSEQAGRYQRSAGGMVGALVVLLVVLLAWLAFKSLISRDPVTPARTVDYAKDVPAVQKAAGFDVAAPPSLPEGWRATTVSFEDGPTQHWHLGVLTDQEQYVGVEQSERSVRSMVEEYVDETARRHAPTDVAGRPWSTYTDDGGDLALVRHDDASTTLVVGHDVPRADLVSYAASLR